MTFLYMASNYAGLANYTLKLHLFFRYANKNPTKTAFLGPFLDCSPNVLVVLDLYMFRQRSIFFDSAQAMLPLGPTYVSTVLDLFRMYLNYVWNVLDLFFDCARLMFQLCSTYDSIVIDLCFDCARLMF